MLPERSVEELEERGRLGVMDPFDALRLRRLLGQSKVEKELTATVEHLDAGLAARLAAEATAAAKQHRAREARLQECRDAVMRAGGPMVLQQYLMRRDFMQRAARAQEQQQRWRQTNTSGFGGFTSSGGTSNTFFYTS